MSNRRLLGLLVVTSIACVAGCSRILDDGLNPKYCEAHPTDPDCRREFPDAYTGCMSNAQCSAPTAVCAIEQNKCVQCTATDHAGCTGTTPACSDSNVCRACSAHTECASSACLPSGACGDDTNVAYVDPSGTGTICTKLSPCLKVDDAIKTGRPFVKFHGVTNEQVILTSHNVTFLADPSAQLTATSNGILLKIDGSSQVSIYDLEITGASGANNAGISMQPGNTAALTLTRVKLSNNSGAGISADAGTVNISQSTISGNGGGGISLANTFFSITNNFIYRNGNTVTAAAGGVGVDPIPAGGQNRLEFNTIVDNQARVSSTSAGGLLCDQIGFVAAHNLIFRNTGGATGDVQTLGICAFADSFSMKGASNIDNTPGFAHPNATPFDYHLTAASPNTIVDAAGACTGIDFDGDTRPIGPACDLGADERKP